MLNYNKSEDEMRNFGRLVFVFLALFSATLFASDVKNLAVIYDIDGDVQEKYNNLVEKRLKSIGFTLANAHHRVNDQYRVQYGSTNLSVLSFLPVVNDDLAMSLFDTDQRVAGFSPFNMLIYKREDEKQSHVGHLTPEAMLDILGIEDRSVKEKFIASFAPLDEMLEKEFGVENRRYIPYQNSTKKRMINFIYEFQRGDDFDVDDFLDDFQNRFELAFINQGYLIAGYHNFFDAQNGEKMLDEKYDAFWTYSLCHLGYSYAIFDGKNSRTDAALFAPCTMYIFIPKDSNRLYLGMPSLANVENTLEIKDPKKVEWMRRLDLEIPAILSSLGMKAVANTNPAKGSVEILKTQPETIEQIKHRQHQEALDKAEVTKKSNSSDAKQQSIQTHSNVVRITIPTPPKPPKVPRLVIDGVKSSAAVVDETSRSIKFSKKMPPNYIKSHSISVGNSSSKTGIPNNGQLSAYLRGAYLQPDEVQSRLKNASFKIVAKVPLDKNGDLVSIVFTDKSIKDAAKKKRRGFASTLRVLCDKKSNLISITNPIYIQKGFLQDEFSSELSNRILDRLLKAFGALKNSEDALKYTKVSTYRFMNGMPQYSNMLKIATGKDLLKKAKEKKNILFVLPLDEGRELIGMVFSRRTQKFIQKIGTKNAALLPFPILIEDDSAYILDPKYYISFMYPDLQMSQFMSIATIPDDIVQESTKIFR